MARGSTNRPNWLAGAFSLVWLIIISVPILSMIIWSLTTERAFREAGPLALPTEWTLGNVVNVIERGFLQYYWNTGIVTVGSIVLSLSLALPAAYAIVRSKNWLATTSFRMFLLGLAIPAQAVIIPLYLIVTEMGLYDTLIAVILPTVAFTLPLAILILSGALRDVPRDVYEAMTLDGAGTFRILISGVIPVARGSIAAVGIFIGLQAWNNFIFPLIFIRSEDKKVVTLGLREFQQEFAVDIPGLMMGVLLSAVPVFLLYLFARRWLIAGLAGLGGK
ncbi:carbohydrate ABC transporter permease [Actinobacteria bacterium YIM 96077]|uniref:Carbohydrate ABC transporter permease n=1 Tax=Phytoactinopolyspora halophila TaxID=1981511 RepID=A0A329QG35_9ACTN|nr:carbohydrate ABC transporter permease [Phytoactinopolyspora halophila]AYY14041.1 carbohydrate ABC transporter permease [Actinobacteria bacterium YIM 96077]RAW10292.1 carbohydrate ABC transporter permease [Phytoactinopolyspora halophila]